MIIFLKRLIAIIITGLLYVLAFPVALVYLILTVASVVHDDIKTWVQDSLNH